jgi:hypothetical protein
MDQRAIIITIFVNIASFANGGHDSCIDNE